MFYTEEIKLERAQALLSACGLSLPQNVDYTAGVFRDDGRLAACGSLKGDMIQGVAVDPDFQGEDLTAKVVTQLVGRAGAAGLRSLYLFTKPEKAGQFAGLGFRTAATARPYAALLEWGEAGIRQYVKQLEERRAAAGLSDYEADSRPAGCLVMNCNPFTLGHRYLIERAVAACGCVFLLVVEEDVSLFSFADRLAMVEAGTANLPNVNVIPGGRYAVSSLTFPSYFTKEENLAAAHAAIDAELFAAQIGPALGVGIRFVGTEPFSPVTEIYNQTLKKRLPRAGICVEEIPRLTSDGTAVSATAVRHLLMEEQRVSGTLSQLADSPVFDTLARLVPETTLAWLQKPDVLARLEERIEERLDRAGAAATLKGNKKWRLDL